MIRFAEEEGVVIQKRDHRSIEYDAKIRSRFVEPLGGAAGCGESGEPSKRQLRLACS
jgi:hypothetical protein